MSGRLWLRWSLRDLRSRWLLVLAIALVVAIGTGMFAGLGSLETWRVRSNDASYASLNAHDLKVTLAAGSYVPRSRLRRAVEGLPGIAATGAQERLVVPTQVDASHGRRTALVPGELVGIDLRERGALIDGVAAERGRTLRRDDARSAVAVVESGFAEQADLPARGSLRIAGRATLRTVGQGTSPDYFLVTRRGGGEFGGAETSYAVLFVPIRIAQAAAGHANAVNELLLTLPDGVAADAVAPRLQRALAARLPALGTTVETLSEEPAHRVLYKDAHGDQRVYGIFSWLILGGAAFACFNLASRVVEAQRREIGVGMALGIAPRALAVRPLLLGTQIAVLGAALGVGMAVAVRAPLRGALEDLLPLPVVETPFELGVFLRGAILGLLIPVLATALPVWRAVRMQPIDAIRVGFRSAKGGGLAPLLRRVRLPGGSLAQMPARNVLRAARRTFMTVIGIAAVIAVLVSMLGMIDSFLHTVDRSKAEVAGRSPDRIEVGLDRFRARHSPEIRRVESNPAIGVADPRIAVPARVRTQRSDFDVALQLLDYRTHMWRPTVREGPGGRSGILLSEKAAEDLGVEPGDFVLLRHPRRTGPATFENVETRVRVSGVHPDPFRTAAYMDMSRARLLGLDGLVNRLDVVPAPGRSLDEVKRALFGDSSVVSVEAVTANAELLEQRMDDFVGVLRVIEAFVLFLALLIAFNSSSITADERAREHATMFAFGIPVGAAVRLAVTESLIVGLLATSLGIAFGMLLTRWVVTGVVPDTFPDLGMLVSLSAESIAIALVLGTAAVALAPLLTTRRMRRMDVPATLRVVE